MDIATKNIHILMITNKQFFKSLDFFFFPITIENFQLVNEEFQKNFTIFLLSSSLSDFLLSTNKNVTFFHENEKKFEVKRICHTHTHAQRFMSDDHIMESYREKGTERESDHYFFFIHEIQFSHANMSVKFNVVEIHIVCYRRVELNEMKKK